MLPADYHDPYSMNRKERRQQARAAKKSGQAGNRHAILGRQLANQGRIGEAIEALQLAVKADREYADGHYNLGVLFQGQGKLAAAIGAYRQALAIKPDYVEAHNNLGFALQGLGRRDEAVTAYHQALAVNPDSPEIHNNLGLACKELGRLDEALASYRQALAVDPGFAKAHSNLGSALQQLGRLDEALDSHHRALHFEPGSAEAQHNLGNTLQLLGRLDEALECYRRALAIDPAFASAHVNLGNALKELGRMDEAAGSYRQALAITPDSAEAHYNLGTMQQAVGQLDEAVVSYRKALVSKPDYVEAGRSILYAMLNVPGLSPGDLFAEHLRFAEAHTRRIAQPTAPLSNDANPDRRLRVGYLSSDFRNHPVASNVLPVLCAHDPAEFEIFCYADVPRADAMTARLQACANHWRSIVGKPDAEVAAMVRADGIDLLVCLAGHFDHNRPLICAHRAAPVQVSFHDGATSGLREMDYWLTDGFLHPAETQEMFSEQLHRLPVFYQWPAIEEAPPVAPLPAARAGFITFASFNSPTKLNGQVIGLWAEVLKSNPGSKLLLKYKNFYAQASLRDPVAAGFAARGIAGDRVIFAASRDTLAAHLGRYGDVDIALDPFPFNGATTTFQALWMGVPVVTLAGETFISRAAGSILHHAGLGELAVDTPEAYVACTRKLAEDVARLRGLREGLRQRMAASPLRAAPAYARSVETAYRDMWRKWCAGAKTAVRAH